MLRIGVFLSVLLSAIAAPGMAVAQKKDEQDKKRIALTDIDQVDEDFAYQGEYYGALLNQHNSWEYAGLQVLARGDSEFRAAFYSGGLPGAGWNGSDQIELRGHREGQALTLSHWPIVITIDSEMATVYNGSQRREVGYLQKVHRRSPTLGQPAPPWSTVLFDGTSTEHFKNAKMTEDGLLQVGTQFQGTYRDYMLHLEFRLPYMPYARGQGRSNSGVYLQSRYEVQILDSFGLKGEHNECGALYRQRKPDVNMCFPPLTWQTYDIHFRSPRFNREGEKVTNARLTVYHNGVPIHNDVQITSKTGAGAAEEPKLLPTKLQDHSNPVVVRNIWLVEYAEPSPAARLCSPVIPLPACRPDAGCRCRCRSQVKLFRRKRRCAALCDYFPVHSCQHRCR